MQSFFFSRVPEPTIECGRRTPSGRPAWGESVQTRQTRSPVAWISTVSTTSTTSQVREMLRNVKLCSVFIKSQWAGATEQSFGRVPSLCKVVKAVCLWQTRVFSKWQCCTCLVFWMEQMVFEELPRVCQDEWFSTSTKSPIWKQLLKWIL